MAVLACGAPEESTPPTPAPAGDPAPAAVEQPSPAAEAPTPELDVAAGGRTYATFCASCHGATGGADTPIAASLDPRPTSHSDGHYMNGVSDEALFRIIKEGGPAVGRSPLMVAWGGSLSDAQIRDVVAFIRTLADPPYQPPPP
jgi:mono/diheme cytochrome c family protein